MFKGQLVLLAGLSRELSLVDPSSSDGGHTHAVTDEDYYVLGVTKYVLGSEVESLQFTEGTEQRVRKG